MVCALVLCALGPARADATQRFTAPYQCGTDDLARAQGVLVQPAVLAPAPQTPACRASVPAGAAVWTFVTATSVGTLSVSLVNPAGGGVSDSGPCVFAAIGEAVETACHSNLDIEVAAGDHVAVGSFLSGLVTAEIVPEIDVSLS